MDAPHVDFKVRDLTDQVSTPINGIHFVQGRSKRGPFSSPDKVITNWPMFLREYGGLTTLVDTLQIKRMLEKGAPIRFSRIGHYTTIANRSTLSAVKASPDEDVLDVNDVELFELVLKNPGADYNNVKAIYSLPSNGREGSYFNITITHALEPDLNEFYENVQILGGYTAGEYNFLKAISDSSGLMDVVYKDLSALDLDEPVVPVLTTINYEGGTDGGTITATDIIGDPASSTGFYSFDNYDDAYQIFVVGDKLHDTSVDIAGNNYAATREDLMYWIFLPTTLTTASALVARKNAFNIANEYSMVIQGGLKVTNPLNAQTINVDGSTDVAALASYSDTNFGINYSFSGNRRGVIRNALGVVNNFGTPAKKAELNQLANARINSIILANNQIKLWGGFTTYPNNSQRQFVNVVRGIMFIKKSLRPTLENYLEEPNDIPTWKLMFREAKIFLDNLVEKRALYGYQYYGDQDAKTLDDLQINTRAAVAQGKYRIKLVLEFIPGIQAIEVWLIISDGTLSFETIDSVTN